MPDKIDNENVGSQEADLLIAQEKNKNAVNRDSLDTTPYIHNSTGGYGLPFGSSSFALWKIRSYKPLFIAAGIFAIVGLTVQYLLTGHIHIDLFGL